MRLTVVSSSAHSHQSSAPTPANKLPPTSVQKLFAPRIVPQKEPVHSQQEPARARMSQNEPEGVGKSQGEKEEEGGTRRSRKEPEGAIRRSQQEPEEPVPSQ